MLALAAERAQGAHPYLVTPEHTAKARSSRPDRWLLPEQAVVLEANPDQARRSHAGTSRYLDLPNYTNNWRRLGFTDDDLVGQGSDRLVDALVAWGDVRRLADRRTIWTRERTTSVSRCLTRSPMACLYVNGGRWPWPCC